MSFCFGFISNDAAMTQCALEPFAANLTLPEGAPNGWGLSYYQVGQPLLRKQPKPYPGPLELASMAASFRSNLVLGHVRHPTIGSLRTENTHPFRFRNWTFCHVGSLGKFVEIKEELLRSIPEHLRRNIHGRTDSEHIFHLFLSYLNDTGKLDDQRISPLEAGRSLLAAHTFLDRMSREAGGDPCSGSCLVSNGQFILAICRGVPLGIRRQNTYSCPDESGRVVPAPHLKSVVLIGGNEPTGPGWEPVEQGTVVTINAQLEIASVSTE